ncbi:MAG: hypothetical protein IKA64_03370 [Clostridia bacterium]|nr:hypothetical protein [Clostridia bacterium]
MLKKSYDFCDIIRKDNGGVPVFVYRSGLTTYEEEFVSGSFAHSILKT